MIIYNIARTCLPDVVPSVNGRERQREGRGREFMSDANLPPIPQVLVCRSSHRLIVQSGLLFGLKKKEKSYVLLLN